MKVVSAILITPPTDACAIFPYTDGVKRVPLYLISVHLFRLWTYIPPQKPTRGLSRLSISTFHHFLINISLGDYPCGRSILPCLIACPSIVDQGYNVSGCCRHCSAPACINNICVEAAFISNRLRSCIMDPTRNEFTVGIRNHKAIGEIKTHYGLGLLRT